MKKILTIVSFEIGFLIVGIYVTYQIMGNVASYNKTHDETETDNEPSVVTQAAPTQEIEEETEEGTEEEINEQTSAIGGVTFNINLNESSTEFKVIDVMHQMTHQKVRAEDKWGAVPMTDDTIQQVYELVTISNFENKIRLLNILENWKKGDFEDIDEDHNYFWNLQGGTVGQAYGKLSPAEEEEFIKNNFHSLSQ
ncbi:DUF6241 domain-containing protein [Neobacillus drentensis]|uniref:DUF6241 domain-containing protein n=1 Tax=Neobacillus drentensis TaxID=220684 RepID=UPI002FFEDBB8